MGNTFAGAVILATGIFIGIQFGKNMARRDAR